MIGRAGRDCRSARHRPPRSGQPARRRERSATALQSRTQVHPSATSRHAPARCPVGEDPRTTARRIRWRDRARLRPAAWPSIHRRPPRREAVAPAVDRTARRRMSATDRRDAAPPPPSTTTDILAAKRGAKGATAMMPAQIGDKTPRHRSASRVKAGQRIGHHRNGIAADIQRPDLGGEQRRRCALKPADLDAAARRDLDDAVAVRRAAAHNAGQGVEPDRRAAESGAPAGRRRSASAPTGRGRRRGAAGAFTRLPPPGAPRDRDRRRCGADARGRAGAPRRSRSAIARAAAGFSRSRKSRTCGSPR